MVRCSITNSDPQYPTFISTYVKGCYLVNIYFFYQCIIKGRPHVSKSDEFSEKFQTAFDPPPHFRKVTLRFSRQNCDKSAYVHMEEHLCILWSYFPWDACSTNVQHGNKVKTYPKRPFCITFMLKKPCLKVQILQYKFLDWKWPPPPPFGTFPKIHPIW